MCVHVLYCFVNCSDVLMCYGSGYFTCSSVWKLVCLGCMCVCVYMSHLQYVVKCAGSSTMCFCWCREGAAVLKDPVSSCQRTFRQVALDFYFVLTAVTQGSAICTCLMDFSYVWFPPALSSSFSATVNPLSSRLLSLQVSSWPLGKFWWLCLVWLWSSDGCVWCGCGCGVVTVVFIVAGLKAWSSLVWRRMTTRDCATTGPGAPGTPFRSSAGDVLPQ